MNDANPPRYRGLWVLVIALLVVAGLIYMLNPAGEPASAPADTASSPAAEYTTPPADQGVAVDLPETAPDAEAVEPAD